MKKLSYLLIITIAPLVFSGCIEQGAAAGTYRFSFERDMEGWVADGSDLDNPPVEWSIERSQDIASDGDTAIRLYLNNINGAGKIWIQQAFDVERNHKYQVRVGYDLASADWGDINLWTIITGVSSKPPEEKGGLIFQGDTGNNANAESGFVWLYKSYEFTVESDADGKLYATIGIWGTWETARTYYVDNVQVVVSSGSQDAAPITPTGLRVFREEYDPTSHTYGDKMFLSRNANNAPDFKEYRIYRSPKRLSKDEIPLLA